MKRRFTYILSFLIFLSLTGPGKNISTSCPKVNYDKGTELVSTTNTNEKDSNCFYYNQYSDVTAENLSIQLWANEYILCYNQKVDVKIISQTNLFCEISSFNFLINKSYLPRKSIEYHPVS